MSEFNPYEVQAGPELDRWIHVHFMGQNGVEYPSYSSDENAARQVLATLKTISAKRVILGRTSLRHKRWFARYETDESDGTEVLASTQALAICRLALLHSLRNQK